MVTTLCWSWTESASILFHVVFQVGPLVFLVVSWGLGLVVLCFVCCFACCGDAGPCHFAFRDLPTGLLTQ